MTIITKDASTINSGEEYEFQVGGRFHIVIESDGQVVNLSQKIKGTNTFVNTVTFDESCENFWFTPNEVYKFTFVAPTKVYVSRYVTNTTVVGGSVGGTVSGDVSDSTVTIGTSTTPRTLASKLSDVINVKDFGAIGDGVADDSVAFTNAFNSSAKTIIVPATSAYYRVKDVTLPAGKSLVGVGRKRVYNPTSASDMNGSCAIVFNTTGSFCIKFGGHNSISNVNFYGVNKSRNGFGTDFGGDLVFTDVSMCGFNIGFGSQSVGGINTYNGNNRLIRCHASQNNIGVLNFVDTHFTNCEINANGIGVKQEDGANDCTWVGCKVEWNGLNWSFYRARNNTIVGGITDRSTGTVGFDVRQSHLTISGTIIRRNGRASTTTSSHFIVGSNDVLTLNGVIFRVGQDDGLVGDITPSYIFDVVDLTTGSLLITGCDLTGYTSKLINGPSVGMKLSGNKGIADTIDYSATSLSAVLTNTSVTLSCAGNDFPPLNTFQTNVERYRIDVSVRNSVTGSIFTNVFYMYISRGGSGNASATIYSIEIPTSTNVNTTGALVNLSVNNITPDGSSFSVILNNTTTGTLAIFAGIKRVL